MYLLARMGSGYTPVFTNGGITFARTSSPTQQSGVGWNTTDTIQSHWFKLWSSAFVLDNQTIVSGESTLRFNGGKVAKSSDPLFTSMLSAANGSDQIPIITREVRTRGLLRIIGGFKIPNLWSLDVASHQPNLTMQLVLPQTRQSARSGVVEREFSKAGNTFRLYTYWLNSSGVVDTLTSTHGQVLITVVDSLAANNNTLSISSSTIGVQSTNHQVDMALPSGKGCLYHNAGRATVAQHQDAVILDLEYLLAGGTPTYSRLPLPAENYGVVNINTDPYLSNETAAARGLTGNNVGHRDEIYQHVNTKGIYTQRDLAKDGYGGGAEISGVVLREGVPVQRRVRLYVRGTGSLVASAFSNPSGQYKFTNLDPAEVYYVMSFDSDKLYNAVIEDIITP